MKKVYTFALAMGVAASAMALNPAKSGEAMKAAKFEKANKQTAELMLQNMTRVGGDYAWDDLDDWKNAGYADFKDNIVSAFFSNVSDDEKQVRLLESESCPGVYCVLNPWNVEEPEDGAYALFIDARLPQCVFLPVQNSFLGNSTIGQMWFQSVSQWYVDANEFSDNPMQEFLDDPDYKNYNIYLENGCIYFPGRCCRYNFPDSTAEGLSPQIWYYVGEVYDEGYLVLPGGTYSDPWVTIGDAQFLDGILAPWFAPDEMDLDEAKGVATYQKHKKLGSQRLVNMFSELPESWFSDVPCFYFDTTDPRNVVIPENDACLYIDGRGNTSLMGVFPNFGGADTYEGMLENFKEFIITYDEATRTINFPPNSVWLNWDDFYQDGQSMSDRWYRLNPEFAHEGWIILPDPSGVNSIVADENAPVEYYTIDGMRVNNPVKGQLIIVRQGSKASKQIIK